MQGIRELRISVRMLRDRSYYGRRHSGLTHVGFILFQKQEEIVTDNLLVSDEGVRVLDQRE